MKKAKVKAAFCVCLAARSEAARTWSIERDLAKLLPGNYAQHLSFKALQLWTVSVSIWALDLPVNFVSKICSKALEKPKRLFFGSGNA